MKTVAVHSGSFHADDVFAVAILRLLYPGVTVIRTRDPEKYNAADARLDVGLKYNHETKDYDHHQKEGAGARKNGIPYATAGLIWKHYGHELAQSDTAWERIDEKLIAPIDAGDNGVMTYTVDTAAPYTIPDIVSAYNPNWQDESADFDACFERAVHFAKELLQREIHISKGLAKAREIVRAAIANSPQEYIILEKYCPWKSAAIEESTALFCLYPSSSNGWCVQSIPKQKDSFEARALFPESWAGLEATELAKVSGVPDAQFCHRARFFCAAGSKEGALALVKITLEN